MTISCPIAYDVLVKYWAADLADDETAAVDEHLFECTAACLETATRIGAVAQGVRDMWMPPVVVASDLARAHARGVRTVENSFRPDEPGEAVLTSEIDVLVHRLLTDLAEVESVAVDVVLADGTPLIQFDSVPFDRASGEILIACNRHFVMAFHPMQATISVTKRFGAGRAETVRYPVLHVVA